MLYYAVGKLGSDKDISKFLFKQKKKLMTLYTHIIYIRNLTYNKTVTYVKFKNETFYCSNLYI